MVPVAVGSQTAGSVIRPASYCGVYGFKPTHGLIPRTGMRALSRTLDHVGIFARSLEDLALLAELLMGHDEGDPDTGPRPRLPLVQVAMEEPPLPPMLALVKTPHWERAAPDTREAFAELAAHLGAQVEEVELLPSAAQAWDWHDTVLGAEMALNLEREWTRARDRLSPALRERLRRGRQVSALAYLRALAAIRPLVDSLRELFEQRYDAILTPAAPGTAPRGLHCTGNPVFCTLWTLCGMPAVSLPLMQGADGLPLGAQLVGPREGDARLLRTARWLAAQVRQD
jgi:Asp-tRNA(Asn)/Glu-tRNA(Gln) amidotransferase A subunit family amidase